MNDNTAYRAVFAALVARLTREGLHIGGTAEYPRVEVHSFVEGEPMDKFGSVRVISATVESMTTDSMVTCSQINDENMGLLQRPLDLNDRGFTCFGIMARQIQDLQETSDTQKSIFRLLISVDVFVEKIPADGSGPNDGSGPDHVSGN